MGYPLPGPPGLLSCGIHSVGRGQLTRMQTSIRPCSFTMLYLPRDRGFASSGALLTSWSPQVPAPLSRYHGVTSPLITSYASKTRILVCSAIEAHKHFIQLLEALTKISSPGAGDLRVTPLFSGLACTASPTREVLYKQLGYLRFLCSE